jgi:hypothetical protein
MNMFTYFEHDFRGGQPAHMRSAQIHLPMRHLAFAYDALRLVPQMPHSLVVARLKRRLRPNKGYNWKCVVIILAKSIENGGKWFNGLS